MFTNISWSEYCIAIGALVLVWYMLWGVHFYYKVLMKIFSGKENIKPPALGEIKSKALSFGTNDIDTVKSPSSSSFLEPISTLEDVEELSGILINAIKESAERNLSKNEFTNYLRLILGDFQFVKASTLRENVNKLIVSECEKHPQLILTYGEADGLWEEFI
jgi:hypothetical protein